MIISHIDVETRDYGIHRERILMIDKLMAEKSARAGGWKLQDSELTFTAFLAWQALHRAGKIPQELGHDDFVSNQLVDAIITQGETVNPTNTSG